MDTPRLISDLLAGCPALADQVTVRPDEPYGTMTQLARALVDRMRSGDHECFLALFAKVEHDLAADESSRNLLIVGFLEDLQNLSLHAGVPLDHWRTWLGPEATAGWDALTKVWAGEISTSAFNAIVDTPRPRCSRPCF
jgi:hypothetical protein